jgi:hypothetical protein
MAGEPRRDLRELLAKRRRVTGSARVGSTPGLEWTRCPSQDRSCERTAAASTKP